MILSPLFFLLGCVQAAPKKRAPLVDVNPVEIDFLNTVSMPVHLGLRFKYRGQTLFLKFNHELHFPGIKKYWLATYDPDEAFQRNLSSCVYDITKNHEFPQLLDEPNESSLLVFRCPNGCNSVDIGCKNSWDMVKIALGVLIILAVLLLTLCIHTHKARDKMKAIEFDSKVQSQMLSSS